MTAAQSFEWQEWATATAPPADSYDPTVLADNPLFYLKLNEASGLPQDSSANNHDPSDIVHPEALTYDVPGVGAGTGKAMRFDPLAQVRWSHAAWMAVETLTIEARVKLDAALGSTRSIVSRRITNGTSQNTWQLRINAAGQLNSLIWAGAGALRQVVSSTVLDTAAHTLGMTYDGRWTRLYVDGIETDAVDHGSVQPIIGSTVCDISMGAWGDSNEGMDGVLGNLSVVGAALPAARMAERHAAVASSSEPITGWLTDTPRTEGLVSWQITQGRTDANAKAEPLQVTVALAQELAGPCPEGGSRVRLAVVEGGASWPRFTGEVTDPMIEPRRRLHTLTCVGRLGRARRAVLDGRGWPQELDGDRVARVLKAAAPDLARNVDPGTAELIRPTEPATAGAYLDEASDSTLGLLVERRNGTVEWHDAEHRRGSPPVLTLDSSDIINDLVWAQYVGDVVNDVQVTYGNNDGSIRTTDPESVEARGSFPASVTTALKDKSDAHALGSLIVGRRSEPVWQLPQLVVDLTRTDGAGNGIDAAKRAQLLDLRVGDRLTVSGLPAGSPFAATIDVFLEGLTETAYRVNGGLVWRLALAVSEPRLSGVSLRWKDVPEGLTWLDVDPTLTWLDVAQIEDGAALGAADSAPDLLDGGDPYSSDWTRIVDGGAPDTTTYTDTIDGGTP
jgi:hypothetical protein